MSSKERKTWRRYHSRNDAQEVRKAGGGVVREHQGPQVKYTTGIL